MKHHKAVLWGIAAACVFGCADPSSETAETGNLKIRSYSAAYTDPADITAEGPIYAILDAEYPDGSVKTVVTDALGSYDFGSVNAGTYRITPRYVNGAAATEVTVRANENAEATIVTPVIETAYYLLNPNQAPVNNAEIREALTKAVVRQEIIAAAAEDVDPLYSLLPAKLSGPWCSGAAAAVEAVGDSREIVGTDALELTLSYNNYAINQLIAEEVEAQWEAIGASVTVNLNGVSWEDFVALRDENPSFQAARGGWRFDSNNPLFIFKAQAFIDDPAYLALLQETETHLQNGQILDFEAGIVALSDFVMDNYLVIPLYQSK
ncbi:MAG: hypothetical protein JW765_00040 [Deltaproteobacteria bacterium]|nr:hypothetical protein [Candidatus Zymogenaceae bacterium]